MCTVLQHFLKRVKECLCARIGGCGCMCVSGKVTQKCYTFIYHGVSLMAGSLVFKINFALKSILIFHLETI